ncbi:MAG: molybdopterin-guanine dinucleotide biosynthesis protein B [Raoultibacter sp.]|jgi:molybdopterin-guanine dinucleotide biosynthesis protein
MSLQADSLAIAFVGRSNSGKTTLVEKVIAQLSQRGHRVGSVKHHGHLGIEVDKEGKDSWRHMRAGSVHTVISSPDKLVSIENRKTEQDLSSILATMTSLDIVIVEGYREADIPYFELFREGNPRDTEDPFAHESARRLGLISNRLDIKERAEQAGVRCFDLNDYMGVSAYLESCITQRKQERNEP